MTLDELIEELRLLRQTPEDGQTEIVLEPDAWTIHDYLEIGDIEREDGRFMIRWD